MDVGFRAHQVPAAVAGTEDIVGIPLVLAA
jgi:hypothetical protein